MLHKKCIIIKIRNVHSRETTSLIFLIQWIWGLKHAACQFILHGPPIDLFSITERSSAQCQRASFLCFLSQAWKLQKVCNPWMAMFNTHNMREQCSKYKIFWFCSENYEAFFIECLILKKVQVILNFKIVSFACTLLQFETPYSSLCSFFSMLCIGNNNPRKGNGINYCVHQ
jgi:hypothetical protein